MAHREDGKLKGVIQEATTVRKITPYRTKRNAVKALDNGGRLFNLLTHADDGRISAAELGKAAGIIGDRQSMFLHLDMALAPLDDARVREVRSMLSDKLKAAYKRKGPRQATPAEGRSIEPGRAIIVVGVPRHVDEKAGLSGFITVPMTTGNVTTMMMVPIFEQYDVYEVSDPEVAGALLVTAPKGKRSLEVVPTRFGGVVKVFEEGQRKRHDRYLEARFYTPLDP
ncbi:MAG: hypothetical protein AAGE01_16240 [Pseudomonadota bacterium]